MPNPDVVITLPEGWEQLDNPDGPLTYSPDGGDSVLQLSSPAWGIELRDHDDAALAEVLAEIVEGCGLGRVLASGPVALPYGRGIVGELEAEALDDARAWLIAPATHEVIFATWLAREGNYGDAVVELLRSIAPTLLSTALAGAVEACADPAALASHALLLGNGVVTRVELRELPQPLWDDACRVERARAGAEIVIQVLSATARNEDGSGVEDVAMIYGESATHARRLLVAGGSVRELPAERTDLFAAASPRVAQMLAAVAHRA